MDDGSSIEAMHGATAMNPLDILLWMGVVWGGMIITVSIPAFAYIAWKTWKGEL
jgi:hypothetical protein